MIKAYKLSWSEVLHEISYPNLILLSAVIPNFDPPKERHEGRHIIQADDPDNNNKVKEFIESL